MLTNRAAAIWNPTTGYQSESPDAVVGSPEVYIKDARSGLPVPFACTTGDDDSTLQLTTVCDNPLVFDQILPFSDEGGETSITSSIRKSKAAILICWSDQASVSITVWGKSKDDLQVPLYIGTVNAPSASDSNGIYRSFLTVPCLGCVGVLVTYNPPTSGEVSISLGVI
jgi:hypothetical protein